MNPLSADRFTEFYEAAYGYPPFPWQVRLAKQVCSGGEWPRAIALPTAAGKTTCLDISVFALACRAKGAARRLFFVVDRRIVVDQAQMHADKLAKALAEAKKGILKTVADALKDIGQSDRPLDVYALRGGMYRETAWVRSPLQPTVIASTVDQVGSRLLFRGYGVSDSMKPVHAALVGNDSLILLDEAHCAKPFQQTAEAVERYRGWNESSAPFRFVSITATPTADLVEAEQNRKPDEPIILLQDLKADRDHAVLGKRIKAPKMATLVAGRQTAKKKAETELLELLEKHARDLAKTAACVGIIVNRVKTARDLKAALGEDAVLLTGRMRPLDRDRLFHEKLQPLLSGAEGTPPKFVIGTQCLEVGADFDFHALVTECAGLDALRQRFGRLNRIAARKDAPAVIVIRGDQAGDTSDDPIYGASLGETWRWLRGTPERDTFDFGIAAMRTSLVGVDLTPLNAPSADAPVLFPAHLDCWVQTHPIPTPDPEVALWLHGPKEGGQPDVQVVFRDDLGDNTKLWAEIVGLCPPSSSEAVAVPIGVFKKWLAGERFDDTTGDVEGTEADDTDDLEASGRSALCWKGADNDDTEVIAKPDEVRPTRTYVVRCQDEDVQKLADFPDTNAPPKDFAEEAFQRSRDKALLRLPKVTLTEEQSDDGQEEIVSAAIQALATDDAPEWLKRAAKALEKPKARLVAMHPTGGVIVTGRRRLMQFDPEFLDDAASSYSPGSKQPVTLEAHSRGVAAFAVRFAAGCGLDNALYLRAGFLHDLGKLDPRFQRMLGSYQRDNPLAKSRRAPRNEREREEARLVHRYPKGARHELLSVALLADRADDDLLHLIATHHGSARPFADAVEENDAAKPFDVPDQYGLDIRGFSPVQQIADWNPELAERFWRQVRQHGWWGSAYREAVFRLADHAQSRAEQEGDEAAASPPTDIAPPPPLKPGPEPQRLHPLPLPGLDGSNPLAFLAALGALRCLTAFGRRKNRPSWLDGEVRLSWAQPGAPSVAVLHLPGQPSENAFSDYIAEQLAIAVPVPARRLEMARDVLASVPDQLKDYLAPLEPGVRDNAHRVISTAVNEQLEVAAPDLAGFRQRPDEIKKLLAKQLASICPKSDLGKNGLRKLKELLDERIDRDLFDHPASLAVALVEGSGVTTKDRFTQLGLTISRLSSEVADWAVAHHSELVPDEGSQLLVVRSDYLRGNLLGAFETTSADHIRRALFAPWDYADGLVNRSLHWEPTEDRRRAYQWHEPNGDPNREVCGGMLGANRLALEAWPLFPCFPKGSKLATRGFTGTGMFDTFWTWPLWSAPLSVDAVASLLSLPHLQKDEVPVAAVRGFGVTAVFRSQRIIVNKTPNLTQAVALM